VGLLGSQRQEKKKLRALKEGRIVEIPTLADSSEEYMGSAQKVIGEEGVQDQFLASWDVKKSLEQELNPVFSKSRVSDSLTTMRIV